MEESSVLALITIQDALHSKSCCSFNTRSECRQVVSARTHSPSDPPPLRLACSGLAAFFARFPSPLHLSLSAACNIKVAIYPRSPLPPRRRRRRRKVLL